MSAKASIAIQLLVKETIVLDNAVAATDPVITYGITGMPYNYSASSAVDVTQGWSNTITLAAGVATVNLAALTRTSLPTVNLTGLKVRSIHIKAASTNTALVTIVPGAANGYAALGLGLSLTPGGEALIHNPSSAAISASLRTLDLASAHATASVTIVVCAGVT